MALGYRASYLSCSSYTGCLASKNLVNAFPSSNSLARVFRWRSAREITIPFRLPFSSLSQQFVTPISPSFSSDRRIETIDWKAKKTRIKLSRRYLLRDSFERFHAVPFDEKRPINRSFLKSATRRDGGSRERVRTPHRV